MLVYLRDRLRHSGKTTFSKGELSLILGVYSEHVKKGEWRDYAIDSLPDMAVFSVYRSSRENPAFSIAKIAARGLMKSPRYAVYAGSETLKQAATLSEVLDVFTEET